MIFRVTSTEVAWCEWPEIHSNLKAFLISTATVSLGNPEIVSQDTQRDKNGFAQTTIYKYPNGMGSSSVSTSYSGSSKLNAITWSMLGAITILLLKLVY
uniref:Uncharacterized protein n=1 Tax=Anopheles funestus TaxID=62324 RepID=A0A182RDW6_ANOFN